jgi:hypothetical protein
MVRARFAGGTPASASARPVVRSGRGGRAQRAQARPYVGRRGFAAFSLIQRDVAVGKRLLNGLTVNSYKRDASNANCLGKTLTPTLSRRTGRGRKERPALRVRGRRPQDMALTKKPAPSWGTGL